MFNCCFTHRRMHILPGCRFDAGIARLARGGARGASGRGADAGRGGGGGAHRRRGLVPERTGRPLPPYRGARRRQHRVRGGVAPAGVRPRRLRVQRQQGRRPRQRRGAQPAAGVPPLRLWLRSCWLWRHACGCSLVRRAARQRGRWAPAASSSGAAVTCRPAAGGLLSVQRPSSVVQHTTRQRIFNDDSTTSG